MNVDARAAAAGIQADIKRIVGVHSARGVLIGLSGGLDSAVLTTLAVRALGKDRVHVFHLHDRDSERQSEHRARLVADWLGLELQTRDIEPLMRRRRVYSPLILRLTSLSPFVNRYLNGAYCRGFGESPFMSTLRVGSNELLGDKLKKSVYNLTVRHIEAAFNARHLCRRQILEKIARLQNRLVLGAANRSEWLLGWFVKGGIDDLPLSPLKALYKTHVRQLATYFGIPSEVLSQSPSPDMIKGITDEFAIGITYPKIDAILAAMERGLPDEQIIPAGVTREEIFLVREMNRLSSWKRQPANSRRPRARVARTRHANNSKPI